VAKQVLFASTSLASAHIKPLHSPSLAPPPPPPRAVPDQRLQPLAFAGCSRAHWISKRLQMQKFHNRSSGS